MISLNNVVQLFDLAMLIVPWAFSLRFQLGNNRATDGSLIGIDHMGLFPVLQPSQGFALEPFHGLRIPGDKELKVYGVLVFVHRPVQISPFSADLM